MRGVRGEGSSSSCPSSLNVRQSVRAPRNHSIRAIGLGGPSGLNAPGLRDTFAAFHAGPPGRPSRESSWSRCPDPAGVRRRPAPSPRPSLRSCSPRRVVPCPGPAAVTDCLHLPRIPTPWPRALLASQIHPPRPPPRPIPRKTVGFPLPPAPVRPPLLRPYSFQPQAGRPPTDPLPPRLSRWVERAASAGAQRLGVSLG